MPPARHAYDHPHDTHGGNAITDNDRDRDFRPDDLDLIDKLLDNQRDNIIPANADRRSLTVVRAVRASNAVGDALRECHLADRRLSTAIHDRDLAMDALSPEERAEFDRRTT